MSHNRRNFLKTLGAVSAGAGLLSQGHLPLNPEVMEDENINFSDQEFKVTILQTTDVHCQIHSHDIEYL